MGKVNWKDNIGSEFIKGGVSSKIIGSIKVKDKRRLYVIFCSICSLDEELFPEGSIVSSLNDLKNGRRSCACSKGRRWSEDQNIIRVNRIMAERGYIFHGWFGVYTKDTTFLDLENPATGNRWNTTTLNNLLHGFGDPVAGRNKTIEGSRKGFEKHIKDIRLMGSLDVGATFNDIGKGRCEFSCPVCSADKYSMAGIKSIFESSISHLKYGKVSCRCSPSHRWSKEERILDVQEVCNKANYQFLGFQGGKFVATTKVRWKCSCGEDNTSQVYNFVKGKHSCSGCSETQGFGFYPNKALETDILYVISLSSSDECFIKIGRSFNLKERFKEYRRHYSVEVIHTTRRVHSAVLRYEKLLHRILKPFHITPLVKFGGSANECFSTDVMDALSQEVFDSIPLC